MSAKKRNSVISMTHDSEDEGTTMSTSGTTTEQVMKAVRGELRKNRETMIEEVQQLSLPAIEAAVKRAMEGVSTASSEPKKKRKTHIFKSPGNKRRFDDTEDIIEKVDEAIEKIGKKNLDAAKDSLEQGKKLLLKQQKYVKMADREVNGWEVVRHYASDDLASDSDDEKAINRARREALASIKKRNLEKLSKESEKRFSDKFRNASHSHPNRDTKYEHGYSRSQDTHRFPNKAASTICFFCGREGHMQYACPRKFSGR